MQFDKEENLLFVWLRKNEKSQKHSPDANYYIFSPVEADQKFNNIEEIDGKYQSFMGLVKCSTLIYPRDGFFYLCERNLQTENYFASYDFFSSREPGKADLDRLDVEITSGIEKLKCKNK